MSEDSNIVTTSKLEEWDIIIRCYSVPLILGIFAAIIHENISPSSHDTLFESTWIEISDNISITFEFLINEIFMMYFFGFVTKRVIQSLCPPNGSMYPLKRAISPIISSFFGMLLPIILYLLFISIMDVTSTKYSYSLLSNGWAIPMSTDVALSWAVSTFIFNEHLDINTTTANLHEINPCISFLLLLAICDDIIGLIIIAIFYKTDDFEYNLIWLLLTLFAILLAFISNKYFKIYYWWYYIFIIGTISWFGFLLSGIHPAVSLIVIMPFMIIKSIQHEIDEYDDNDGNEAIIISNNNNIYSLKMLNKFEKTIGRFIEYGLFFFSYCNAAVQFNDFGGITICVFFSLFIGKIIGVSFGAYLINKLFYIPLPAHMKLKQLPLIGFCAAISLIVSLFIADIAWDDNKLIDQAKFAVLTGAILVIIISLIYRFWNKQKPIYTIKQIIRKSFQDYGQMYDAEMTNSFK